MGYYRGDFYRGMRGDFYRGDPGFFSFLGGIAKSAVGMIPGVGGIASSLLGKLGSGGVSGAVKGALMKAPSAIMKHPVLTAAGAAGAVTAAGEAYKHRKRLEHAVGIGGKKHRRMNPCNIHALRRSIRRAKSFERIARKVLHFTSPKKARGVAHFKMRRRKKTI